MLDLEYEPKRVSDFRDSFEKVLVGKDGKVYYRFHASTDISVVADDINTLLSA